MNRMLALVAVASLGTGCIVSDTCDVRIVAVRWPDFHPAAGGPPVGCSGAGVSAVNVWVDGILVTDEFGVGDFACGLGGIDVFDVFAGTHDWVVEGIDSAGRIVNRDWFTTSGDGCETLTRFTRPAAGSVDLRYRFTEGATPLPPAEQLCAVNSVLWLSIFDEIAANYALRVDADTDDPDLDACVDPAPEVYVVDLPIGDYTLDWMEERGPSDELLSADCVAKSFTVSQGTGDAGTPVTVNLNVDATVACPRPLALRQAGASGRGRAGRAP